MEIFLILIFIALGIYIAFLTGILNSLTQDFITSNLALRPEAASKIDFVWDYYDRLNESFHLSEHISYLISSALLGAFLLAGKSNITEFIAYFVIYIIALIVFRTAFHSIGRKSGEKLFLKQLSMLTFFGYISAPIFYLTNSIFKAIQGKKALEDDSREEISAAVESAREEGSLDDDEYRILKNIMRFSDVLVSDVMTPRTVIFSWNADNSVNQTVHLPEIRMYSRFPIWEGESLDDGIMGYIMSKDILHAALQGKGDMTLRQFRRDVYYIPENARLDTALDMFLNRRQHLFVVVDEYGGVEGLLTMEDVLETMLGVEIVDEADRFVDMRLLAKQRRDRRISVVAAEKVE